ncbi:MAG TPA: sigma 54-interacting transcriptional regulator [Candidatus Eisenbacteria bacterium]|jgi:Nif-specific regulatory protein
MIERFAGRFLLLRRLGQGGMGEVFLARDLTTGAECALKRLSARGHVPDTMRREFEALSRVHHPAIVAVHELGSSPEGLPYLTMEHVPGAPADRALARGDWAALIFVAARVAHGLEALHASGLVHGDLKPSNLLVVPGPTPTALPADVRLVDFGLAALLGGDGQGRRGTPGYAAPETARGEEPTPASDLYGLGATLYTLMAGRLPFEGDEAQSILRRQQSALPPALPLEEVGAPPSLVQLVLRLMAPDPSERPADAREVRQELERISPQSRRPLADRLLTVVVVGREREFARLELALGARAPSLILVLSGPAGCGKSTLLAELAVRATLAGQPVAHWSCAALEGPGAVARAAVRRLAAEAGTGASPDAGSTASRAGTDFEAQGTELDLDALADEAARWAAMKPHAGPLLVLLDDVERLDALSRSWIRRLIVRPGAPAIRCVWARRSQPEGPPEDERVMVEAGLAEIMELGPLDREAVVRLASARLNEPAPPSLAEFLWSRGGGHPGLTVELLRTAASAGALAEQEAGLVVDAERLRELEVPRDFEASLLERFEALPAAARAAAAALAVWGKPLSISGLRELAPEADEGARTRLIASGLAAFSAGGSLVLSPPALADGLLRALGAEERCRLHQSALDLPGLDHAERFRHFLEAGDLPAALKAAESAFEEQPDESLAAEAAELAAGSSPELAAVWHERTARELAARGRFAAAVPHWKNALALDPTGPARPERWVRLSSACLFAGQLTDVAETIARALEEHPPPAFQSKLLTNESARQSSLGDLAGARATAERALALAETASDPEAIGPAAESLAYYRLGEQRTDEAEALALRAAEAYQRAHHAHGMIRSIGTRAAIARVRRRLQEAERLYREALEGARARALRLAEEEVLVGLAVVLTEAGQWKSMHEVNERAVRVALEDARSIGAAGAMTGLAQADGLTGRARAARRHARAAIALTRAHRPRSEAYAWRSLAQAHRIAGRLVRAERAARRALSRATDLSPEDLDWCRIELGRVLAASGAWSQAEEVWETARQLVTSPDSVAAGALEVLAGRAALRKGRPDRASARLKAAQVWLENHPGPYVAALARVLEAELALKEGRIREGVETGDRALQQLGALPAPADRAAAALELARMAPATEELSAPVARWLDLATGTFERLGDRSSRERALALQVEWLRRHPVRPPAMTGERNLIERVSWLLHSLSDPRELTQRAMQMAVEQLDAERGVLLLVEAESGQLALMAEHGAVDATTRREAVGYSRRVVERVTESGDSLLITDAPVDPRAASESVVDMNLRSILCVPLFLGGQVVGAAYLDDSRRAHTFGEADRGMLEGFAHLMAVAIEKSRGHDEVRRVKELLEGENLSLRQEVGTRFRSHNVIGSSTPTKRVLAMAEHAARTSTTVLLTGENGTGKELIARTLHHGGKRRLKPFTAVNCGAIPESLIESELFGILPNVATGVRGRPGRFVQADGGTLFLDEIGEMPLKQQVTLLSAIANREITPVGGGKPIPVDVRIIAATNQDLRRLVQRGAFREDLYYRLNVIEIEVPPLRERKADIPALTNHFLAQFAAQQERELPALSAEFLAVLMQSDWPGNVRELQNYIERVLAMTPGRVLHPDPLPRDLQERGVVHRAVRGRRLIDSVVDLERRLVGEALERAHGNQSHAARELGLTEQSIRYRIRKYGLAPTRGNRRTRRI